MHEIGVRETVQFAGYTLNWETLCMTWLTMAIVILIAVLATRGLSLVPSGWQNVVEMIIVWLHGQIDAMMGERGRFLAPLYLIPLGGLALVSLVAWLATFSAKR